MNLDWLDKAVCAQVGADPFFPELGSTADQGKALCRSCEARVDCLAWALSNGERDGVLGGFTERPRRKIAQLHQAGKPLEDIIAEDDARVYARLERPGSPKERRLAAERRRRRARIERTAAASSPQPAKAVA